MKAQTSLSILSLALCSSFALAQEIDPKINRWLLQHPTDAQRGEVLLDVEREQIARYGRYDVSPYMAPAIYQLRPSQEYLQSFYDGQNELARIAKARTKGDYRALRKRYQMLYNMHDPAYQHEAEYYLGYVDYAEGKYNSALKHFNALPKEDKYQETVPFYRMQILYVQGHYAEAIREANAYAPSDATFQQEAMRIKAECLLHSGKETEALGLFRRYLKSCSNPVASSAFNAGVLEYKARQYGAAIADGGIATQSGYAQLRQYAYMLVGQSALQQAETQKARLAFEQASAIAQGDAEARMTAAYNVCAIAHNSTSLWGDEVRVLENFLNAYPSSPYVERVSGFLIEVYSTTRNYEAALQSIAKIKSPNASLRQAKQKLHYQWGIQHYLNGAYSEAVAQFGQSIQLGRLDPVSYAESYFWRGESRYHLEQYAAACSDYQSFTKADLKGVQQGLPAMAEYSHGYALTKQENYAGAISHLTRFLSLSTDQTSETYADGMLRLADCYYYTRQFANAESFYHNATLLESRQKDYALFQEALMMGLQKKYSNKQQTLDLLLASCPESGLLADAWLDKGRTSLLQNESSAAISSFQQVLDLYPESPIAPQAAVELALTYNNLGQTKEAQRIYELVAERYPNSDAAQTAAEDLRTLQVQQRIASLPDLYAAGQYDQLLETYQMLLSENVDFRTAQTMQVLAGKAHLQLGHRQEAVTLLQDASSELRTAAGSEAKYLLAQAAFDGQNYTDANTLTDELLQSGTPHQYWLARGIILKSDLLRHEGEVFTADEYLKSLQQNYTTQDDIQQLIESRLEASSAQVPSDTTTVAVGS